MEEVINSIIYGKLEVEIPNNLTLRQQLEIVRALIANPTAHARIKMPSDLHPWTALIFEGVKP